MKLGSLAGGVCRICGSDTMGADIGCGCLKMYNEAKFIALKNHGGASVTYNYDIKMQAVMNYASRCYEEALARHNNDINKVFKTDFNRKFFPWVFQFYKEHGYVSGKQLKIVEKKYCVDVDGSFFEKIEEMKKKYLDNFASENDSEIVEIARNLWKQKK